MFSAKLLSTKTFWSALAGIVTGVGLIVSGDVGNGATTIVLSVLAICGRDAIAKSN